MRKGAPWLKTALVQFAWAAARKKASYFQAQFHRLRARRGANATVVCGHTVGEYAFIAAGAVVARDVPAFALMAGVSARRIGWVSHAGERLGPDLVCPRSGRRCRESGHDRIEEIV
jgi:UDP-2-acetamido-3-amino-2,3-dideoxy-glucuronate N-acetyltransferase